MATVKPVRYCLVDTFTETPFKGNPSVACLLEEDKDAAWLQNMAREFNQAATSYLTRLTPDGAPEPVFNLRWFTRDGNEIAICGHSTLAAAHFLFSRVVPKSDAVQLSTLSGPLIARRIRDAAAPESSFATEMEFPVLPLEEYDSAEIRSSVAEMLNGVAVVEIKRTIVENFLFIVLESGEAVAAVEPQIDAMRRHTGAGVIITGSAPSNSGFDFYLRAFCPNAGTDEDPVCGSAHCALAPYWSQKLHKHNFMSYQASKRSGVTNVHFDEKNQRVMIRGRGVAVMEGTILI